MEPWANVAALPVGAHNSLAVALVALLSLWLLQGVSRLLETRTLKQQIQWQGGCVMLRGMAAYAADFKRLRRTHISQILRLRRSQPAVIVPRVVVSLSAASCRSTGRTLAVAFQQQQPAGAIPADFKATLFAGVPFGHLVKFAQQEVEKSGAASSRHSHQAQHSPHHSSNSGSSAAYPARQFWWQQHPTAIERLEPLIPRSCSSWQAFCRTHPPPDGCFVMPGSIVNSNATSDSSVLVEVQLSDEFTAFLHSRPASSQVYLLVQQSGGSECVLSADRQSLSAPATAAATSSSSSAEVDRQAAVLRSPFAYGIPAARTVAVLVRLIGRRERRSEWMFSIGNQTFFSHLISPQTDLLDAKVYYNTFRKFYGEGAAAAARGDATGTNEMLPTGADPTANERPQPRSSTDSGEDRLAGLRRSVTAVSQAVGRVAGRALLAARGRTRREHGGEQGDDLFSFSPAPVPPPPAVLDRMYHQGLREVEIYGLENEAESDCLICMAEKKQTVLLPCGHSSCCTECLKSLRKEKCPVCRSAFLGSLTIPMLPRRST